MNLNLNETITHRINKRIPWKALQELLTVDKVYVAGNCLNRSNPNDIDLFPVLAGDFTIYSSDHVLSKTPNAITVREDSTIIQLCNYHWNSLKELVDSFDFAHIQIGAKINVKNCSVEEIYCSDNWVLAHQVESTWFTGSAFPLSSLIRANKYIQREEFAGKSYIPSIFDMITAIVTRGFENYKDFKDQLDAVDLGLLPEDLNDANRDNLMKLFEALRRDK
jgi:hypothetical protein